MINIKMVEYNKVDIKLSHTQLKNKTGMSLKIINGNNLPHELLLTTRQKTKVSKAQISKIIESGGLLGLLLSKLAGPLMKVAIRLAKNVLAPLGITAGASAIDAGIKKKNSWFWEYDLNNFKRRNE